MSSGISLSWADINDDVPEEPRTYLEMVRSQTPPQLAPINKKKSSRSRCYTCKPRGKVEKHIISRTKNFVFHHDMHKRPMVLITPVEHYEVITEIPSNILINMFEEISKFCEFWNIEDYQVQYNCGSWKTHSHFHAKIKTAEKIINRLRRDHFKFISLKKKYDTPTTK